MCILYFISRGGEIEQDRHLIAELNAWASGRPINPAHNRQRHVADTVTCLKVFSDRRRCGYQVINIESGGVRHGDLVVRGIDMTLTFVRTKQAGAAAAGPAIRAQEHVDAESSLLATCLGHSSYWLGAPPMR